MKPCLLYSPFVRAFPERGACVSISLSNVDESPVTFAEEVVLPVDRLDPEQVSGPLTVRLEGRVLPMDGGYLVDGSMEAEGQLTCVRCLVPVPWKGKDRFSVELRHPLDGAHEEIELGAGDLDVVFITDDQLDVERLAAEQVMLNLPMRILCQPECAGLCPRCGANKNQEGSCQCEPEVDPRWESLRGLEGRPS